MLLERELDHLHLSSVSPGVPFLHESRQVWFNKKSKMVKCSGCVCMVG